MERFLLDGTNTNALHDLSTPTTDRAFQKEPFYEIESLIKTTNGSFKALLSPSQRFLLKRNYFPLFLLKVLQSAPNLERSKIFKQNEENE